jgi:phospholipase C
VSSDFPQARSEGLISEELDGQLLLYDRESSVAHALDRQASALWRACDGDSDVAALAVRCNMSQENVRLTLARLEELGLLAVAPDEQSGETRRSALRKMTLAGVGLSAGIPMISSVLIPTAASAMSGQRGQLSDIQHVVILIQENRSFDHYFGTYPGVRGFADPVGSAAFTQSGYPPNGGTLLPFHLGPAEPQCFPDITHDWAPQHQCWDGGAMDHFVSTHLSVDGATAGPATMGYYERADIPFYHALADAFTICDRYHCSVIGPTDPNRLYTMSATIDPDGTHGGPLLQTQVAGRAALAGHFTWTTMPEQLSAAGVTWKVYTDPAGGSLDNVLTYFHAYQTNPGLAARGLNPVYPTDFQADLAAGTLPQVSWINTSVIQTEHPGISTAQVGEFATQQLVKALFASPLWDSTALFVTWDENGGFFDHVAPPVPPAGTPGEFLTAPDLTNSSGGINGPIGLGFRVPMLIVSPFSRGGFVSSDVFDHTSVLRFLEARFGVPVPNLTSWRRGHTGDLTSAFNFAAPDTSIPSLPTITAGGGCSTSGSVTVPPNSMPQQQPGSPRRPSGP